jgi:hypothetical protein
MAPRILNLLEQLLVSSSHYFGLLQHPEIFVHSRLTLFLETPEVIRSQITGIGWVFHFINRFFGPQIARERAPCGLEHCHGGESNRWA